ncbi:ABC transporter ATP-binding protein, partial [Pseudomonas syringae pv. tagetis]
IAESYLAHLRVSKYDARERTLDMRAKVHTREPASVYELYPHEVSGVMGQSIMIAIMVITEPLVIFAVDPSSALDVSVLRQVLK